MKRILVFFNGTGIKQFKTNNQGYMITHKTDFKFSIQNNTLQLGYSLQYRKADNLLLPNILPESITFSGDDFRYNLFAQFKNRFINFQTEILLADLDGQTASGYYFLSVLNHHQYQIIVAYEKYKDLIKQTPDQPYYRLGYNYLIDNYKIKISLDNYFQIINEHFENFYASIQIQLFNN